MFQHTPKPISWTATGALLVLVALSPSPTFGAPAGDGYGAPSVRVDISGSQVTVQAPMAFETAVLRVSKRGEADVWSTKFDGGSTISVNLAQLVESGLTDGRYDYQVQLTLPGGGDSDVERDEGTSHREARTSQREAAPRFVTSGRFDVEGGSIRHLDPRGAPTPAVGEASGDPEIVPLGGDETVNGNLRVGEWGCYGCGAGTDIIAGKVEIFDGGLGAGVTFTADEGPQWSVGNRAGDFAIIQGKEAIVGIEAGAPAEALRITADGRIGVGTTSPANSLEIARDGFTGIRMTDTGNDSFLEITRDGVFADMRLDGSTNITLLRDVGVAISDSLPTPSAELDIRNLGGGNTAIRVSNSGGTWVNGVRPTGDFVFNRLGSGGSEFAVRPRLDASGPTLDVQGSVRGTQFISTSSREVKTAFEALEPLDVLAKLAALPVSAWRYRWEDAAAHHVGPVAEDFHRLFGLGDGKTIGTVDADGVMMAAIQGLKQLVDETRAAMAAKDAEISELASEIARLQTAVEAPPSTPSTP